MGLTTGFPDLDALLGADEALSAENVPAVVAATAGTGGGLSYDGSNATDKLALWNPRLGSADSDMLPEKDRLDARTRDTLRNDAYVAGASARWKDSIVGARYMLNARPNTKVLWGREDEQWETEFQEEVESKFNLWSESPQNWADASRRNSFTSIIRLGVGVFLSGGEILGTADWMPDDGRPFRTAFQMIDGDRLSDPANMMNRTNIRKGVEVDSRGTPVAYHFRNVHPSDGQFYQFQRLDNYTWKRIPARKPWGRKNVLHVFEQMRPGQTRGISVIASALSEMRMAKHFRKTQLEKAIIAATYSASIEAELPADIQAALGSGLASDGNPTTQWMIDYLESCNAMAGGGNLLHMNGAQIPILPPGSKLHLQNPGAASPDQGEFEMSLMRYMAAALGISYEQFSGDFSNTNYSSARASMGETWKTMLARKKMAADETANFIYRLWLEEAINYNQIESLKRRNVPLFYEGLNSDAYSACEWIGAGQGQIDPVKETQAAMLKVKNGFSTKEQEIAKMHGGDYRAIARQIARERKLDEELGNPSIYDRERDDMENALSGTPSDKGDE